MSLGLNQPTIGSTNWGNDVNYNWEILDDAALKPKTTAPFVLDGDDTGNTRGNYAVDMQLSRSSATEVASGSYSSIGGGLSNTVNGIYSTVSGGRSNTAGGSDNTIGGGRNNISTGSSYCTIGGGQNNNASSAGWVTIGGGNSNTANAGVYYQASTVGGGHGNTASGDCATVSGGYNNTTDTNCLYATIGGGHSNSATDYSFVGGGYSNDASGDYAIIGGGYSNDVSGDYATIGGGSGNEVTNDYSTIGGGLDNSASTGGKATVAGGWSNTASGAASTVSGGRGNTATNWCSTIIGGAYNDSTAYYSTAGGYYSKAHLYGQVAFAAGKFANEGDAQQSSLVAFKATTNDSWTELFIDGVDEQITLNDKDCWLFSIYIVGRKTGDYNVCGAYKIEGCINREDTLYPSDTTNLIGTTTKTIIAESDSNWDVRATADNTNSALKIEVLGTTSTNIRWVAKVDLVQVNG